MAVRHCILYLLKFQPQTKEHLAAIDLMGLKHIIVLQNKIDLIPREKAQVNFREIKKFVQGTPAGKRISILNFNQNLFYREQPNYSNLGTVEV